MQWDEDKLIWVCEHCVGMCGTYNSLAMDGRAYCTECRQDGYIGHGFHPLAQKCYECSIPSRDEMWFDFRYAEVIHETPEVKHDDNETHAYNAGEYHDLEVDGELGEILAHAYDIRETCEECNGTGNIRDEDGYVWPCRTCALGARKEDAAESSLRDADPVAQATVDVVLTVGNREVLRIPRASGSARHVWDGVPVAHVKNGHQSFDERCRTCFESRMRSRYHKRMPEKKTAGQVSADIFGPMPTSLHGNEWGLVVVKRDSGMIFTMAMPNKDSYTIAEHLEELGLLKMRIWRMHSDSDKSFLGHVAADLRTKQIVSTDIGGYDPASNGIAENAMGRVVFAGRGLMLEARVTLDTWDDACLHATDILNRTGKQDGSLPALQQEIELARPGCGEAEMKEENVQAWPPWGCRAVAMIPKEKRGSKMEPIAVEGIFLGFD